MAETCEATSRTTSGTAPEETNLSDEFDQLRLLLLEDNAADVHLLRTQLSDVGIAPHMVDAVPRLAAAVSKVRNEEVSVVLADLGLPDASGLDAVQNLHAAAPDVPIVVMTGLADEDLALRALQAGAQDYFVKGSFEPDVLRRALRYAIQRESARGRIAHLAHHDVLTGLPNRLSFSTRLQQVLSARRRSDRLHAVLYIDLDGFKPINDRLGHDAGDAVLLEVSTRMLDEVREADTVARLGGDEFAILLEDIEGPLAAEIIADRLIESLGQSMTIDGETVRVSCSVGVAIAPHDGDDVRSLVKVADRAMYEAKGSGGARWVRAGRAGATENTAQDALYEAVDKEEFELHVQPQVDRLGTRVLAVETYLRWNREGGVTLKPRQFMERLERSTLSLVVGEWVLRQAAEEVKRWRESGLTDPGRITVNVSRREVESAAFISKAIKIFEGAGLGANCLELDVREDLLSRAESTTLGALRRFRAAGGWVAIDGFGSGRCPLSALASVPADAIKFDASIVSAKRPTHAELRLAEGIVELGRRLGMTVVAKRVESEAQVEALLRAGCDRFQGNYFVEPTPMRGPATPIWLGTAEPVPA